MAFWGVELKPGKPYTHAYREDQHRLRVTQAVLSTTGKSGGKTAVQVNVGDKTPIMLCNLIPQKTESCHLELEFRECDDVVFSVLGSMSVYLSGYFLQQSNRDEAGEDESDSYGEDIAETESDCSGSFGSEDDEYESDFIDDGDMIYSTSRRRKSNVVIEEIVEDKPANGNSSPHPIKKKKKQSRNSENKNDPLPIIECNSADGNSNHPLAKRRNQVSDSEDNIESHRQIVKYGIPTDLESEDEDGFPILTVKTEKKIKKADDDATSGSKMSEDKKRKIDAIIPDTAPPSGAADATSNGKSKKKKKKKDRQKNLHEAMESCHEKAIDAGNHHAGDEKEFVLADDRNQIADIEVEKRSDTAGNEEPVEAKSVGKSKNKKKAKASKAGVCPDESQTNEIESNGNPKDNDSPADAVTLQAHKKADGGSSIPMGSALESAGKGKKKKRNKAKADYPTANVKDTLVSNQLSNNTVEAVDDDLNIKFLFPVKKKKYANNGNKEDDLNTNKDVLQDLVEPEEKALPVKTRSFPNGLEVKELSMGKPDGKRASRGCRVSVHYTGKLQNGKIFDSSVGKKPYTFRLGIGEVIKGWDIGIEGMRVGDKRRLTIPPSQGYGEKKVGVLPENSWLIFDVELANVK